MANGDLESTKKATVGRYLFLFAGHLSLTLGIIGLLVPVMPTSPFVILAAACYARSSERFHRMLLNNKHFGEDIRRWQERRCVRRRVKILSVSALTVAFFLTIAFFITPLWAKFAVGALGVFAALTVLYLPVCDEVE